jgi:hypothetical protein
MDTYYKELYEEQRMIALRLQDELTAVNMRSSAIFSEMKEQRSAMFELNARNEALVAENLAVMEHNAQLEQALSDVNSDLSEKLQTEHSEVLKLKELWEAEHSEVVRLNAKFANRVINKLKRR